MTDTSLAEPVAARVRSITSPAASRSMTPLPAKAKAAIPPSTASANFLRDVLQGLSSTPKTLPCTWLYDETGSELFEQITELPEYYPTRTEIALLQQHAADIADRLGSMVTLIELGSGSSRKTRLLLRALHNPVAYVPIDISADFLHEAAAHLASEFPALDVHPMVADFTSPLQLPPTLNTQAQSGRRVGFFPGSTIGNFDPLQAVALLANLTQLIGRDGLLLIGADATRDPARLLPAYDDAAGVTARFNLNLLNRINQELGADFVLTNFRHESRYDPERHRVEMHLVSQREQTVELQGRQLHFQAGESIHTENAYKYTPAAFEAVARQAGWRPVQAWHDADNGFFLHLLAFSGR